MEFNKTSIIKILELIIAIICMVLHCKVTTMDFDIDTLCVIAFGGYIIILTGAIVGVFNESPIDKKIYAFYCVVGCVVFIVAGAMTLDVVLDWRLNTKTKDYGMAKSILAIINGVLLAVDGVLEWQG